MKRFVIYFFIIGFILSVMFFNHGLYEAFIISIFLTGGVPGSYFVYKVLSLSGTSSPFTPGPFG